MPAKSEKLQKVVMRQSLAGHRPPKNADGLSPEEIAKLPSNVYAYHAGDEVELPLEEAERLRDSDIVSFVKN